MPVSCRLQPVESDVHCQQQAVRMPHVTAFQKFASSVYSYTYEECALCLVAFCVSYHYLAVGSKSRLHLVSVAMSSAGPADES